MTPSFFKIYDDLIQESEYKMSKGNYVVQGGHYYDDLPGALKFASQRASKQGEELKVYQAIKLVSPKTPDVDVTDVVLN